MTVAAVLTSMGVSLLTERIAYRPLRRAPRLVPLITAIGASFFWQYIFRGLFGSAVKAFPVPTILEGRVNVFGLDFLKVRLIVIIVSILALIGLYPVSYTHLDVYKRQTRRDRPPPRRWLRG